MSDKYAMKAAENWANKYRPQKFDDLVGQEDAVSIMKGIIKTRIIPPSIGIFGPYGCGKTSSARMLARYLNCATLDACGKCESCKMPEKDHPDVTELNGANTRGIDDVRKLIEKSRFMPRFRFRIFILDEIHQWTPQSAEAFLKPLEEPPPNTIYILGSTDPQKMKPTVLSRLTKIIIGLPDKDAIKERVKYVMKKEHVKIESEVIRAIVEGSGGHMRDAISLLEGAHLRMAGNPKMKTKDLVKVIAASGATEQSLVATKMLLGMYLKKPAIVIKAIFDMGDVIPTMNSALRQNEFVLANTVYEGQALPQGVWATPENRTFQSELKKRVAGYKLDHVIEIEKKLVQTRTAMQDFAVSEKSLLLASLV